MVCAIGCKKNILSTWKFSTGNFNWRTMNNEQQTEYPAFRKSLLKWYGENQRTLPWRSSGKPYHVWVSEVMLQQTQVTTVIPYYDRFLKHFPTVEALAEAEQQLVLKLWEGLGYYARARNFQKAAQTIVREFGGEIPGNYDEFLSLSGVGGYIAAAVQSIAFGHPHAVVDGNVKRVLSRLFGIEAPVNDSKFLKAYQEVADVLLDRESPGDYNQAMMELGALVCRPQNPLCEECPVKNFCHAFTNQLQKELPKRKARKKTPHYDMISAVIRRGDKLLILQRPQDGLLGGLWEFPNGKMNDQETVEAACQRNIFEKTSLQVKPVSYLTTVKHAFTHFRITVKVYLCDYLEGDIQLNGPTDYRWITLSEIVDFPFPKVDNKFIPLIPKE